jgi:dolichol-phosphate mannosyltransferase
VADIALVIPTYNERDNVGKLVESLDRALQTESYEILFVDDDSPDGTAAAVDSLTDRYPVSVLVRKGRRGLASAVVEGIQATSAPIVVVMDADLQHPPEQITALLEQVRSGADVAVASRYVTGGTAPGLSRFRSVASRGAVMLAHALLPRSLGIADPMSGFFALRRTLIDGHNLQPVGYKILLEILSVTNPSLVAEVPVALHKRAAGKTKMGIQQKLEYLAHVLSLLARTKELTRFVKFCAVGLSGVGVNLGILWLLTERAGLFYLLSATISIECSIISNYLLNEFFTFRDRRYGGGSRLLVRLARFNAVSLVGVGLNLGVLWILTSLAGLYYLVSNLCGIVVATTWNYLVNSRWTWRIRSAAGPRTSSATDERSGAGR